MSTDSSAVSDLIRLSHTRRLRTDPGDAILFHTPGSSARRTRTPIAFERLFESPRPESVPATAPARPRAPERARTWRWIAATLAVGVLGIGVAAFGPFGTRSNHDHAAAAVLNLQPQPARVDRTDIAPVIAPVATIATPTIVTPTIVTPTIAASEPSGPTATVPTAPTAPAAKPIRHRPVAKKIAAAKPAIAKKAKVPATPMAAPAAPPAAQPRHPAKPSAQSMDSENPL